MEHSSFPYFNENRKLRGLVAKIMPGEDECIREFLIESPHKTNELSFLIFTDNKPKLCYSCIKDIHATPKSLSELPTDKCESSSIKSNENESSNKEIKKTWSIRIARGCIAIVLEEYLGKDDDEKMYCWILDHLQERVLQMLLDHDVDVENLSFALQSIVIRLLRKAVDILDRNPETTLRMLETLFNFFIVPTNKWFGTTFLNSLGGLLEGVRRGENFDAVLRSIVLFIKNNYASFSENGAWSECEKTLKRELFDIADRYSAAYEYLSPGAFPAFVRKPAPSRSKISKVNPTEKQRIITFMELLQLNLLAADKDDQLKKQVKWFLKETHARWYSVKRINGEMTATLLFYLIEYAADSKARVRELLAHGLSLDIRALTWLDYVKSALSPEFNSSRDFKSELPEAFLQGLRGEWEDIKHSAVFEWTHYEGVLFPPVLHVICDIGVDLNECDESPCNSPKLFEMIREYFKDECTFDAWLAQALRYAMLRINDESYARKILHLMVNAGIDMGWLRNCLSKSRNKWYYDLMFDDDATVKPSPGYSIEIKAKVQAHFSDNWMEVITKAVDT